MIYVITDGKNYITYNKDNQQTMTSRVKEAKPFEDTVKANNYLRCIKKQLQKFHWKVIGIDEVQLPKPVNKKPKTVCNEQKCPSKNVSFEMQAFINNVTQIHIMVKDLNESKINLLEDLSLIDKEICDIMHYAEFEDLNACEGFKVYKMLQNARKRRRTIKDKLSVIDTLSNENNKALFEDIVLKLESMNHRSYKPRVLMGLFD